MRVKHGELSHTGKEHSWSHRTRWLLCSILFCICILLAFGAWSHRSFPMVLTCAAVFLMLLMAMTDRRPNVAIILISVLFSGALSDWMVRAWLLKSIEPKTYWESAPDLIAGYRTRLSDELGYLPEPGIHMARKRERATDQMIYEATYSIGPDGFRITPLPDEYPLRIQAFGGSFMYGEGVNDEQTLPYHLGRQMGVNVKNYAVHGFGVNQALISLEQLPPSEAELNLLLTSPWHAFRSSCKCTWCGGTPRMILKNGQLARDGSCPEAAGIHGFVGKLLKYSNTYRYLESFKGNPNMLTDDDLFLYLEIIREFHRISRIRGEKVMIAFIKSHEYYLRGTTFTNAILQEFLADHSEYFVDVTLAESAEEIPREYSLHALDRHPSATANEMRATIIRQTLQASTPAGQ